MVGSKFLSAHWQSLMHMLGNWSQTSLSIVLGIWVVEQDKMGVGGGWAEGLLIKEALTWKVSGCPPVLDLAGATCPVLWPLQHRYDHYVSLTLLITAIHI